MTAYALTCVACGEPFTSHDRRARCCSLTCAGRLGARRPPLAPIACAWADCGQSFTPRTLNAKYCGDRCKRLASNAAKRRQSARIDGRPKWARSSNGDAWAGTIRHEPRPWRWINGPSKKLCPSAHRQYVRAMADAQREFDALLAREAAKPGRPKKGAAGVHGVAA